MRGPEAFQIGDLLICKEIALANFYGPVLLLGYEKSTSGVDTCVMLANDRIVKHTLSYTVDIFRVIADNDKFKKFQL